ncbi:MAG: hypothetical protein KA973_14275 [Candidatus Microthrix sp.]|nr:hypothetical protein [Candidatus Microthrix sp.]
MKVEILFDGTTWVDVSADVVLSAGLSISRGRDSETGDAISVGTCSFTLQNDTGEYSPDLPASSHYPYVVEGVHLRVSAKANGSYRRRFYGTVQSWSTGPMDETGMQATCEVVASDTLGAIPSYVFRQASDEVIRSQPDLLYHWPLRDTEGPAQPLVGSVTLAATEPSTPGWGAGGLLPLDEGTDQHPLFESATGGLTLSVPLYVPEPWVAYLTVMSEPTADGRILDIGSGRSIRWKAGSGFYLYPEAPTSYVLPTSWPAVVYVASATSVARIGYGDATTNGEVLTTTLGELRRLVVNPTLTGGSEWGAGHLAVCGSIPTSPWRIAESLLSPRINPTIAGTVYDGAAEVVMYFSGLRDVAPLGNFPNYETTLPPLEGRDAADVMGAMVTGMGARLVAVPAATPNLTWVPFGDDSTPVAIPSGLIDPAMRWQTNSAGWVSAVTTTWPDGTTYTATRPDGKRQSASVEAVHATRLQDRCYADWLVNTASSGARLPVAPFDLASMAEADKVTLCSVNPASRVSFTGLPAHMPSALTCICEGLDETLTDASWDITLKLSPDVYSRLGIYDTSTWDSGVLWAP